MKKTQPENDDFRRVLREEMLAYFASDGRDELKTLIRRIVRDELYGSDPNGEYMGDSSTATRVEIRKLIREELFSEAKK